MRLVSCELSRFSIPFKRSFSHAAATRASSDAIIVEVRTASGHTGFGEIQARPYVTGEDNDSIWTTHAPALAAELLGREFNSVSEIEEILGGPAAYALRPACIGGFDIALAGCLEHEGRIDWAQIFGPQRHTPKRKCLTIGQGSDHAELRRQGRFARLTGCSVVKLKVGSAAESANVQVLRDAIGGDIGIRLDGNGVFGADEACRLLDACQGLGVVSFEQPLDRSAECLGQALAHLYSRFGVPFVADESACVLADLERFRDRRAYQSINVRVGKCGGVNGTSRFLKTALDSGFDVVSGTMVGETAVMLRISETMLEHCESLDYVEGLDQATVLTEAEVIERQESGCKRHFEWIPAARERYLTDYQVYN